MATLQLPGRPIGERVMALSEAVARNLASGFIELEESDFSDGVAVYRLAGGVATGDMARAFLSALPPYPSARLRLRYFSDVAMGTDAQRSEELRHRVFAASPVVLRRKQSANRFSARSLFFFRSQTPK